MPEDIGRHDTPRFRMVQIEYIYWIGLHVIEERLTALHYRNFLENEFPLHVEHVHFATRRRMWLQHVRAYPHFGRVVTELLNEVCEGR
jgi:hypothetical protein